MAYEKMSSLLFLVISLVVVHESFANENSIPGLNGDTSNKPRDCKELQTLGSIKSGAYIIWLRNKLLEERPVLVYCDMKTAGGGWTVIQRRGNYSTPSYYFKQRWSTYKVGFGDVQREFWLGNDNIFDLTNQKQYSVHFDLTSYKGLRRHAEYTSFRIDGEDKNYTIHINNYSGTAGDGMKYHDGQQFSTPDRDNDIGRTHCAKEYSAGWWYMHCFTANLNGIRGSDYDKQNLHWHPFKKAYNDPISEVEIKIRPRS